MHHISYKSKKGQLQYDSLGHGLCLEHRVGSGFFPHLVYNRVKTLGIGSSQNEAVPMTKDAFIGLRLAPHGVSTYNIIRKIFAATATRNNLKLQHLAWGNSSRSSRQFY